MVSALVTGASAGVGYQLALSLAQEPGVTVLALARRGDRLEELVAASAELPGTVLALQADLVAFDSAALHEEISTTLGGRLDLLVHNAGALVRGDFAALSDAIWQQMLDINLLAPMRLTRALLPLMGGEETSHVIHIGSMGGVDGTAKFPGLSAYSVSKGALVTLTECLAEELVEQNIRVNCVALGAVQTEMLAAAFPGYEAPVGAEEIGARLAEFARTGHRIANGKTFCWAVSTP